MGALEAFGTSAALATPVKAKRATITVQNFMAVVTATVSWRTKKVLRVRLYRYWKEWNGERQHGILPRIRWYKKSIRCRINVKFVTENKKSFLRCVPPSQSWKWLKLKFLLKAKSPTRPNMSCFDLASFSCPWLAFDLAVCPLSILVFALYLNACIWMLTFEWLVRIKQLWMHRFLYFDRMLVICLDKIDW